MFDSWKSQHGHAATVLNFLDAIESIPQAKEMHERLFGKCLPPVQLIDFHIEKGNTIYLNFDPQDEAIKMLRHYIFKNKKMQVISSIGFSKRNNISILNELRGCYVLNEGMPGGVWMWIQDHPKNDNLALLLIVIEPMNGNHDRQKV